MKTFKFSLALRTRENTDVFISLDDNIYGIHSKRINILYLLKAPWLEASTEYLQYMYSWKNKKNINTFWLKKKKSLIWSTCRQHSR